MLLPDQVLAADNLLPCGPSIRAAHMRERGRERGREREREKEREMERGRERVREIMVYL